MYLFEIERKGNESKERVQGLKDLCLSKNLFIKLFARKIEDLHQLDETNQIGKLLLKPVPNINNNYLGFGRFLLL